jgi:hypothetical protein
MLIGRRDAQRCRNDQRRVRCFICTPGHVSLMEIQLVSELLYSLYFLLYANYQAITTMGFGT